MDKSYKFVLVKIILGRIIILAMLLASALHAQNTYSFTTCSSTGSTGPTQAQINTAYSSTNLNGSVTSVGGIQSFTVPYSSSYSLVVAGAGAGSANYYGGRGKIISGVTNLAAGTVLNILVGQMGICTNTASQSSGGGGGCFIATNSNSPIIVAGGGGGFLGPVSSSIAQSDANIASSGFNSLCNTGIGGTGGNGGTGSNNGWGGGGGGFTGNGTAAINCASTGGISFVNGGLGAGTCNLAYGGFGGGGGTHGNTGGGGGGGGYSGGGGSNQNISPNCGGGGGSYFDTALTSTTDLGFNLGQGYAVIMQLCNNAPSAAIDATNLNNYTVCPGSTATLAASGSGTITWFATNISPLVLGTGTTFVTSILNPTSTPSTYTYYAQVTNTCSSSPRTPITFTVIPSPTVTVSGNITTCTGYQVSLSASGASSYTWNTGATTQNISAPAPAQFTVVGKSATTGCTASAVSNLTLLPSPSLLVTGPTSVCTGGTVGLVSTGADTYLWSNAASTSSIAPVVISTTTFYVVGTYTLNGCTTIVHKPIIVFPDPVLTVSGNNTICAGQSTTLTVVGAVGYYWNTGPTTASIVVSPTTNTTYTVIGVPLTGCTGSLIVNVFSGICLGLNTNENSLDHITIYPNPNNGEFIIENIDNLNKDIEISDVTGRIVATVSENGDKVKVNIRNFANGLYYIKTQNKNGIKVFKVMKQ